ncbi:Ras-related protein Rab6 [Diplonema papillatum]|nr:Ras-related protein Rab6 [Diplonema papillatum]
MNVITSENVVPSSDAGKTPFSKHKVVFLGDSYAGKTSLINRFMYDTFDTGYQSTIGIDFLSRCVKVGDKITRLQLWDTAGQERFKALIPSYIRDSKVAVLVFDVTNATSFDSINAWVDDVKSEREDIMLYLVGNKVDRQEERVVSMEDATAKAESLQCQYTETSAKSGFNVQTLFQKIAASLPGKSESTCAPDELTSAPRVVDPFVVQPTQAPPPQRTCMGCV